MKAPDDRLNCLIENAKCLLNYNTQTGVLPSSNLEETLGEAMAVEKLEYFSEEAIALRHEVFRLVQAIKPATLPEITRLHPFSSHVAPQKTGWDRMLPYAFGIFTVLIIISCAHYTMWTKHASGFMKDVETAQRELASDRFNELMSRWGATQALDPGADAVPAELYTRAIQSDFQTYYAQYYTKFQRLSERNLHLNNTLHPISKTIADWRVSREFRKAEEEMSNSEAQEGTKKGRENAYFSELTLSRPKTKDKSSEPGAMDKVRCLDDLKEIEKAIRTYKGDYFPDEMDPNEGYLDPYQFEAWETHTRRLANLRAALCFYGGEEIYSANIDNVKNFYYVSVRKMRDKIDTLGSWILPGIYGALGAILLTLRVFINPVLPEPRMFRTIARILMGALVGVIVGWFWSPKSDALFEFANISIGLFSVAFVFGYGIDVFMSLLERVLGSIAGAIERIGESSAKI